MNIDFFLEATKTNSLIDGLQKASLITFPSTIYIASSFAEFQLCKKQLQIINSGTEAAYWPITTESYWPSPFSYAWELKKIRRELEERSPKEPLKVLVDLEPPMLDKKLFLINLPNFWQNKKTIERLFNDAKSLNIEITTAESDLSLWGGMTDRILRYLGFSYIGEHKRIIMYYSSMLPEWRKKIAKRGIKKAQQSGSNLTIGLGAIDFGILGNEPKLSAEDLEKDLIFMKENGINTAVIFQLSGLDQNYLEVIEKYTKKR